jgi:large subunit ribosomal protein L4
MATMDVISTDNKSTGSVDLDPAIFEVVVKKHLFHAEVNRQLAKRRAGTHATKNRAAVSGGGAKPYRQKGTGRARQGTTRAPQFKGGGIPFGPVPHGHETKLNKKARKAALRGALSFKLNEEHVKVLDSLELDGFKTKAIVEMLSAIGLTGQRVLIVIEDANPTVETSVRNIPGISVIRSAGLNVYDVLRHETLLFTKAALDAVSARLGSGAQEA